jgi:uncharacterized protein (DUF1800 family)
VSPSGIPAYRGAFGVEQAHRLLWRAGFGPRPGQAERLAGLGLDRAVASLTRPASTRLTGPAPRDGDGRALAPRDAWGHDHCWWLDRMVRTEAPLIERMTLLWHDWFATSKEGGPSQTLMLRQNALLRRHALGSFEQLALDITRDPAMLLWLNGVDNSKWAPNENYARELQELFCLGADRGYGEGDVRELARALTGFRCDWGDAGATNFRFDPKLHDGGVKRVYGRRRRYGWQEGVRRVVAHPKHPSFLVAKLWGAFIPTPPPAATARALERLYLRSDRRVRPLVDAILRHPDLYDADRRMAKPPAVQAAGMLRAVDRYVDTTDWAWLCAGAGQYLFAPPNVAGWDDGRWLDTATYRGRWRMAAAICDPRALDSEKDRDAVPTDPAGLVTAAAAFWGSPPLSATTRAGLERYAAGALATADESWKRKAWPVLVVNALRMLIAVAPDVLTS